MRTSYLPRRLRLQRNRDDVRVNSTYFFQVFLAENLDKRLLLLFQCGGDKYIYDLAVPAQFD
ncbi:hypothetical protein V7S43_009964 [Phytophthora oleae]|uniref:Uncharacterized protein n=1 Tax=Phytophthora oleae TaxID=2107226 RepID=A0ABD3FEP5_9STRA